MSGLTAAGMFESAYALGWTTEPDISVSEWADKFRILSDVASSEPGRWRTDRTPYLREIMDSLSPRDPIERIVFMKGAQVGGTECGNNWLGYTIHSYPGPMLMVQPTVDVAKRVSKQRIAPMIAATPVLRERVAASRSRDSGNTVQVKEFAGGILLITGSNSSAGLRSMPIRSLFLDEADEYPGDVGGQGDPVALAEKRTATFAHRKVFIPSTPTIRGISRVETEFLASDRRYFYVPCMVCGAMDFLTWSGFRDFLRATDGGHHRIEWDEGAPETARMICGTCGEATSESVKTEMLSRGEWRATAESSKTRGFHLSALYSPLGWRSWESCAREFLLAKSDPFKLKTWVNTVLAETWEEGGDAVEASSLMARREVYAGEVPAGVGVLVAAVDVQGDRLELVVKGYGEREESWLVAFHQMLGDPARDETWHELDRMLSQTFKHESGQSMRIECTTIDSGGLHTEQVYRYVKARPGRNILAIKGGNVPGRPLVERPSANNSYRVPLFVLCVDTGKDIIMGRLQIRQRGPGYIHLPAWADDEYVEQLTAERAVRKYIKGRGAVRQWVKVRDRNEAFDLEVYALAALYILGQRLIMSLPERAARFAQKAGDQSQAATPAESPKGVAVRPPPRRTWVRGF